jgi:hypothetical protein
MPLWSDKLYRLKAEVDLHRRWLSALIQAGTPMDKALALWVHGVGNALHLRSYGLHAEKFWHLRGQIFFIDIEEIVQSLKIYIPLLFELRLSQQWQEPLLTEANTDQYPQLTATWGDLLMWGLAVMVDPFIYDPKFLINVPPNFLRRFGAWRKLKALKIR